MGQAFLFGVFQRPLDLIIVIVQAHDVDTGKLDDFSGRAANSASNVENALVVLQIHLQGEVVLMTGDGAIEGLSIGVAAEVERRTPAVLVQVGC